MRQAGVYTISNVVARAIPFLLLPLLTRYVSPADFGIVAMFFFVALLIEPLVGFGASPDRSPSGTSIARSTYRGTSGRACCSL